MKWCGRDGQHSAELALKYQDTGNLQPGHREELQFRETKSGAAECPHAEMKFDSCVISIVVCNLL